MKLLTLILTLLSPALLAQVTPVVSTSTPTKDALSATPQVFNAPVSAGYTDNTNGLVGWYPLAGDANDHTTNGNNGTLVGSPTYTAGVNGVANSALLLNGTSQSVTIGASTVTQLTGDFTISCWAYYDGNASDYFTLINRGNSGWALSTQITSGAIEVGQTFVADICVASSGTSTGPHLFCGTRSGNNFTVYRDGVSVGTSTSSVSFTVTGTLQLGVSGSIGYWRSWIQGVRIYNRAFSSTEAATLYTNGIYGNIF